jgi:hypothetical protein
MNKDIEALTTKEAQDINNILNKEVKKVFDHINFQEIGRLFNYEGKEIEFYKSQVLVHGLRDFHITLAPGVDDETKREIILEDIANWNNKGEPRISVQF